MCANENDERKWLIKKRRELMQMDDDEFVEAVKQLALLHWSDEATSFNKLIKKARNAKMEEIPTIRKELRERINSILSE